MADTCQTFLARVLEASDDNLLVCNVRNGMEILAHVRGAGCFCVGDYVCIRFNGAMTMSIPPQITACRIRKIQC